MDRKKILITGGAGFIGSNFTQYFVEKGHTVVVVDDLSRKGTDINLAYLQKKFDIDFIKADITDIKTVGTLREKHPDADAIIHLAAQVAVTTSVVEPREDFNINLLGTFNMLEYAKSLDSKPAFLFSSTNKVYGSLEDIAVVENEQRYRFEIKTNGIDENQPLDFHSPYGCSKGGADQYVHDYHRIYGLPTVVFRQSCIYGERQFGVEDQGWVAWFLISLLIDREFTIYGNGKQVRDILHVADLARAYDLAIENIDRVAGEVFNTGGGADNSMSILDLMELAEKKFGLSREKKFGNIRAGDQKVFVSDNSKLKEKLGWSPGINIEAGLSRLSDWLKENIETIKKVVD